MKPILGHSIHSIWKRYSLGLILIVSLASCSKPGGSAILEGPASPNAIITKMQGAALKYDWLSAKLNTEVNTSEKKQSFKAHLRMRKDSIIWLSISPALGIEVVRVIMTPDSLKVINKWEDTFYLGDYSLIESKMSLTFDFRLLQDMIVGNPLLFDGTEKFRGSKEDDAYVLTTKSSSKVRRVADDMESHVSGGLDSLRVDEKEHLEILERYDHDEEALTLKRYWVRPQDAKLMRCVITDLLNLRSVQADYSGFIDLDSQLIPSEVEYAFIDQSIETNMTLEYSRVRIDEATTFPFTIPEKFKPMDL